MNKWLSKHPSGPTASLIKSNNLPYQLAFDTDKAFFNSVSSREGGLAMEWTMKYMQCLTDDALTWYDVCPVEDFVGDMKPDQVLWVDVGAAFGHRTQAFRKKFPTLPGKLIIQDLPDVIAMIPPQEGLELLAHDFFEPQPIKAAKFYYLRYVLHDWNDEDCLRILSHLRNAMSASSIILIDEILLQEMNAHYLATELDLSMMCVVGSRERTLAEYNQIFKRAGLELLSARTYTPTTGMSIMSLRKK